MGTQDFKTTQISPDELSTDVYWDGGDRRQVNRDGGELLTKAEFEKILTTFRQSTAEPINNRFSILEEKIIDMLDNLDKTLKSGFPDGDLAEHRRDHEIKIKFENERATLYKQIREKVITSAVWGMFGMIALAVWEYIKQSVHE